MLESADQVRSHPTGFRLEELTDIKVLEDNAFQPEETEDIIELKKRFYAAMAEVLKKDPNKEEDKAELDNHLGHLQTVYGGENRFYERFLLARNGNLDKATKMMKHMVEIRLQIVGEQLVTSAALTNNFYDKGSEERTGEVELFTSIDSFWAIDYWGFTKDGNPLMTGKLKNIRPGKFIKEYNKDEIKRFYFHFMERANILNRYANSPPLKDDNTGGNKRTRRYVEIYDFKGMSIRQFHIFWIVGSPRRFEDRRNLLSRACRQVVFH